MTAPIPQPPPRRRWSAAAIALLVVGLLILIPSGLCTGVFAIPMLADWSSEATSYLLVVLVYGGPFIAIGTALVVAAFAVRPKE
jgi:hypothetical protein